MSSGRSAPCFFGRLDPPQVFLFVGFLTSSSEAVEAKEELSDVVFEGVDVFGDFLFLQR